MESRTASSPDTAFALPPLGALLLFTLLMTSSVVEAGVYKWTDEQGRVHFSDRPVAESSTEIKIKQQPAEQPSSEDSQQRSLKMKRMLNVYEEDRANKKEANQKQQKEREKRKRNCLVAKDRYNSHGRASGIYSYQKDGERRYLSDQERQSHMKKLKADIKRWCQ